MNARRSRAIVAVLVLAGGCAGRNTAARDVRSATSGEAALLRELRGTTAAARDRFRRVVDETFTPATRADLSLDPRAVANLGNDPQRFLAGALERREFAALKDYVVLTFPAPPPPDTIDGVFNLPAVSRGVAVSHARTVAAFLERLASLRSISVDIDVNTRPSEADVRLRTTAVAVPVSRTDTTLKNVYRGLYSYEITKPAFKTASGTLNLVDDDRRTLACVLGRESDPYAQSSCRRQ